MRVTLNAINEALNGRTGRAPGERRRILLLHFRGDCELARYNGQSVDVEQLNPVTVDRRVQEAQEPQ
jgi:hypothetical protein